MHNGKKTCSGKIPEPKKDENLILDLLGYYDAKQVITDIARGEVDLDTLKAGASLIPVAKITKVPKVVKAIGNVGKTGFKKGKEGEKISKSSQTKQTKARDKGKSGSKVDTVGGDGLNSIIENGRVSIGDIEANPNAFSGKSADEIAQVLRDSGYDVTVKESTRSRSGAQIIKINNAGGGKNISQVQVSPGGGRHGSSPYVKISTTDQGIIKVIDGPKSLYKTDGKETATIIFSGGK